MSLVELTSNLKNLTYTSIRNPAQREPFVTTSINDAPTNTGFLATQTRSRLNDVERLSKYFLTSGGPFFAKQAAFSQLGSPGPRVSTVDGKLRVTNLDLKNRIARILANTVQLAPRLLGQAGLSGTGYHATPPAEVTYLGKFAADEVKNSGFVGIPQSVLEGTIHIEDRVEYEPLVRQPARTYNNRARTDDGADYDKYVRLKIGDQPSWSQGGKRDLLNSISIVTEKLDGPYDIIPFEFAVFSPDKPDPEYLYFRAYLESLSDSFSSNWNSTNYIGRAESLYNYESFSRSFTFAFKIAASSRYELDPLYNKLNRLTGTTAPSYSTTFMRGVYTRLTIGDYLQSVPGFFNSIDLTWNLSYPWTIGLNQDNITTSETKVPHILDVSLSFTPVHDFTPKYGDTYFAKPNEANLSSQSEQVVSELPTSTTAASVPQELSFNGENAERLEQEDRERQEVESAAIIDNFVSGLF